jgi:hypothetical protein
MTEVRDASDATYTIDVSLVSAVPIEALAQPCTLLLKAEEIVCVRLNGGVVFAGEPHEFHSYAPAGPNSFHLWHRNRRYRLANRVPPGMSKGPLVAALRTIPQVDAIRSRISPVVPDGVEVRPPLSRRTVHLLRLMLVLLGIGITLAVIAIAKSTKSFEEKSFRSFAGAWAVMLTTLGVLALRSHRSTTHKRTDRTN